MKKLTISAHQPNFLPYIGFIDKMLKSDVFLIRDDAQFCKRDFHHRNRIKINGTDNEGKPNFKWLTVPVEKKTDEIRNIRIKTDTKVKGNRLWYESISKDISLFYNKAEHFEEFYPGLKQLLNNPYDSLLEYNMQFINFVKEIFNINAEIISSYDLIKRYNIIIDKESENKASINLASLCEAVAEEKNCDNITYLSGDGGRGYGLVDEPFRKKNIDVKFQNFKHPVYPQQHNTDFLPCMAFVDFLLNAGNNYKPTDNKKIIKEK